MGMLDTTTSQIANKADSKIVHFVRSPYSMVLSNYFYHAQNPTPEKWVHSDQPCQYKYPSGDSLANFVMPLLSTRTKIRQQHFDSVVEMCKSLFQTKDQLKNATFYEHLLRLDHYDGLRLATAQMIISSSSANGNLAGGDVLRMAYNVLKLGRLQSHIAIPQEQRDEIHILTISMEDYLKDMSGTTMNLLDYIFGKKNQIVSSRYKVELVAGHEKMSVRTKNSKHVTQGKYGDREELRERLMVDPVFSLILNETEILVNEALAKSKEAHLI